MALRDLSAEWGSEATFRQRCNASSRQRGYSFLVLISLLAFPFAYNNGGSGWGPLIALIMAAHVVPGFWMGLFFGGRALNRPKIPVVEADINS